METKSRRMKLLTITQKSQNCRFEGYDAMSLMLETAELRLITKRGTLEILIPLCSTTDPARLPAAREEKMLFMLHIILVGTLTDSIDSISSTGFSIT